MHIPFDPTREEPGLAEAMSAPFVAASPTYALRRRIDTAGAATLTDAEVLEALIARTNPGDAYAVATTLLARFGYLERILASPIGTLAQVVDRDVAIDLKIALDLTHRVTRERLLAQDTVIGSWSDLAAYVRAKMAGRATEAFYVLWLNKKNRLISDEILGEGTLDHAPVYPREFVRRAIEAGAGAAVIVHCHPSGDPTPSAADIEMTRQLVEACKPIRVAIHDHLVVGGGTIVSMKAKGLM